MRTILIAVCLCLIPWTVRAEPIFNAYGEVRVRYNDTIDVWRYIEDLQPGDYVWGVGREWNEGDLWRAMLKDSTLWLVLSTDTVTSVWSGLIDTLPQPTPAERGLVPVVTVRADTTWVDSTTWRIMVLEHRLDSLIATLKPSKIVAPDYTLPCPRKP